MYLLQKILCLIYASLKQYYYKNENWYKQQSSLIFMVILFLIRHFVSIYVIFERPSKCTTLNMTFWNISVQYPRNNRVDLKGFKITLLNFLLNHFHILGHFIDLLNTTRHTKWSAVSIMLYRIRLKGLPSYSLDTSTGLYLPLFPKQ